MNRGAIAAWGKGQLPLSMQNGFFQKVVLCMIIGAMAAGFVEFYKTFVQGADDALNGNHKHVHPAMVAPAH